MSLHNLISSSHKEIAGSRSKNRLTVQISYAMQLIMDFYSVDFLVMMDYIEDVAIICDPTNPSKVHLYQIKTKSSDKQYSLNTVIKDEWFQKLYENKQKYNKFVESASVVCNTDVVQNSKNVFPNAKTSLDEGSIQENIKKVKKAIAEREGINIDDVDLSNFFFVRSNLSTKGHKEEVEHLFENFLLAKDPDLQVATVRSIYTLIYNKLDEKFNNEIDENCTDVDEIFAQKGINGNDIKAIISSGLAVQLPTLETLFKDFNIKSVSERKRYNRRYRQIKMDMYSDMKIFIETKKILFELIVETNESGIDNMPDMLQRVYDLTAKNGGISVAYSDEGYIKMLIMILVFRYCYGGDDE